MALIDNKIQSQVKEAFQLLGKSVKLLMFTQEIECEFCAMTRQLLEEITALSEKVTLEVRDFVKDAEEGKRYGIDKIPAIVVMGEKDYGIRFYGLPAGYEFTTLIEDILVVSREDHDLPPEVVAELAKVDEPVHLQVMISPSCPYCSQAVAVAHRFAMANDFIRADMVETSEFPHLAVKYNVQGVPLAVVNETYRVAGSLPEIDFAREILKALGKRVAEEEAPPAATEPGPSVAADAGGEKKPGGTPA
ncbi:MAG: thioredoxin family protein [Syntrophales bacterium]|jgi:glutaredoxin-like protein|nr:thioredoxin family protein [Syntrophales bacterium]